MLLEPMNTEVVEARFSASFNIRSLPGVLPGSFKVLMRGLDGQYAVAGNTSHSHCVARLSLTSEADAIVRARLAPAKHPFRIVDPELEGKPA